MNSSRQAGGVRRCLDLITRVWRTLARGCVRTRLRQAFPSDPVHSQACRRLAIGEHLPPATKDRPSTRANARASLRPPARRWIGEFAVIVAGVTVALASDSMWNRWQNRQAAHAYMEQLGAELDENTRRLQAAVALEDEQRAAAGGAYKAIARGDVILRDSAVAWAITRRGVHYSDPRVLMGTVTTLISTGDLRLMRDPQLRQAIAAYATQIREDRAEFDRFATIHLQAHESLRAAAFRRGAVPPVGPDTFFLASAVSALTGRPGSDALFAVDGIISANHVRVIYLRRMLATNERLRALIPDS
jgi:hypothetical protein